MKSKIAASAGANQFEAWPVPSAVLAPLKYRVKGSEKPAVYSDTTDADAPERSGAFWQTVSIADGRPV